MFTKQIDKIILYTDSFPPSVGGAENALYNIVKFSKFNFLVITGSLEKQEEFDNNQNFPIIRFSKKVKLLSKAIILYENFSGIIVFGTLWGSLTAILLSKVFGQKTVLFLHGSELKTIVSNKYNVKFKIYRILLKFIDQIICNSNWVQKFYEDHFQKTKNPLNVFTLGVSKQKINIKDVNPYLLHYKSQDSINLLSVGRLVWRKGHDTVIEVISDLIKNGKNLTYTIIGRGEEYKRLQNKIICQNLQNRIKILTDIDDMFLQLFYKYADIFILNCREDKNYIEGLGLVFWEAGLYGVPSIAGKVGGVPEVIINDMNGILIEPDNKVAIKNAVTQMLNDKHYYNNLKNISKKIATENLWKNKINIFETVVETC